MKNQNHEVNIQVGSPSEMRAQIKQNEVIISSLSSSIRKKRTEMKQFSDEMTKLLEKKLIPKHTSLFPHPNFNPQFTNPRNQALHSQRQTIYLEITKLKQEISELLSQEQPAIVNEIRRKEAMFQQLIKEEQDNLKQKQMLQETLNKNKVILEDYKQSQCLKEIGQNQTELEQIKRQIKQLERRVQEMMHEDIAISIYESSVDKHIQQMSTPLEEMEEVDYEVIDGMIEEIRKILDDKKIADREQTTKKQQITKKIRQIEQENRKLEKEIREITNQKLKKILEMKKKQLLSRNKSLPQISNNQKKRSKEKMNQKQKIFNIPSLLLTQPEEPKVKKPKREEQKPKQQQLSTLFIGNWRPENHIKDDIIETRNIARAISMKIRTKDKKITGIGVTYIDKIGVEVLGRSNIWKLSQQKLEQGEEQFTIDLQDVVGLYYYSHPASASDNAGTASSIIGLKFMSKSSRPVIKVGEFLNEEEVEFLNLENRFIKTIQFTLDNTYKSISGIKLAIFDIKETKKAVVFEADRNEQDSVGNVQPTGLKQDKSDEIMPSKWQSTTSQAGLTQKKVFIKNTNYTKKLSDVPQVDHRLMLNRKKKMV